MIILRFFRRPSLFGKNVPRRDRFSRDTISNSAVVIIGLLGVYWCREAAR